MSKISILCDSAESFMAAFRPHAAELQGDLPHYTDTTPQIQVNEVLVASPATP